MLIKKINNRVRYQANRLKDKMKTRWFRFLLKQGKFDDNDKIARLRFDDEWEGRINKVIASEYNSFIPRVPGAGNIHGGFQLMHNGLQISTGDYYGLPISKMLYLNKGVHEPEEEKMFLDTLNKMPANPVMIEMGAYWAFYSMWFLKETSNGKVYMIEPDKKNLEIGKQNFKRNRLIGTFDNYLIGKISSATANIGSTCLDDYIEEKKLAHIDIVHADIQGYEMEMLLGASKTLQDRRVDFFFISTHTNELHYSCVNYLEKHGYIILFHLDLDHVASFDGFILALSPDIRQQKIN